MDTYLKRCTVCAKDYQHPVGKHGRICKSCKNARRRQSRSGPVHPSHYEKTPKGFLMRLESRIQGIQRGDFYRWAISDPDFIALFRDWAVAGWPLSLTPSIDRIDAAKGFVLTNIRWLTHSDNSRIGALPKAS